MAQDTLGKMQTIIHEIANIDKEAIKPSSSFEELGIDSIDMTEIILRLEDTFDLEIKDEDAASLLTVEQAVVYIDKHKK